MQLVECVPNFSEGRREHVVAAIRDAAATTPGVSVLDLHVDAAHNRMVLTFVGSPAGVVEAAFRCAARAAELIDMREHRGEHPRIGATDVVPFVPLSGVTMADCVAVAHQLGRRLGDELGIPVYLYAEAAQYPARRRLPDVRRGQYEDLCETIGVDPERAPDYGPRRIGTAGATAVGARPFLLAYNINLATSDLALAKRIARTVRESSGGFPAVQALGMATPDPNIVQVSMNLLDPAVTPLHVVLEAVRQQAGEHGVDIASSELVGLMPLDVLVATTAHFARLTDFGRSRVIEARLLEALAAERQPPPA
ncbi:MAG: glutamate formimidoyltransferase [Chloroflexota bacterium]|nr:glutamate formimidoyltransferase [Chloroflexota bacterium]